MPKIDRKLWHNPFTPSGLRLAAAPGSESYQIHEAGLLVLNEHWHHQNVCSPFWRVFYDFTSGAWIESGEKHYDLGPELVVVMPDGVPFSCGSRTGVEHLWLHFSQFLALPQPAPEVFTLRAGPAMLAVAAELRDDIVAREVSAVQHTGSALLHLIFAETPAARVEAMSERLLRVINWIEHSLRGEIDNERIAGEAGMSVEGFIRWFKGRTGRTPAAFVAERRIREACRLLAFTEDSIEQVAEAVGFANRHHFSRVFKIYAGCGPARFRRGH